MGVGLRADTRPHPQGIRIREIFEQKAVRAELRGLASHRLDDAGDGPLPACRGYAFSGSFENGDFLKMLRRLRVHANFGCGNGGTRRPCHQLIGTSAGNERRGQCDRPYRTNGVAYFVGGAAAGAALAAGGTSALVIRFVNRHPSLVLTRLSV